MGTVKCVPNQLLSTINMPTERYCGFCQMSGFAGPHDHYVRASRKPNAAVTCPRLLATKCSFCHKMGHTSKYCPEKQQEAELAKRANTQAKKVAFDQGEWAVAPNKGRAAKVVSAKPSHLVIATGAFAALDQDSSDSEQDCCVPVVSAPPIPSGPTWADVAKKEHVVKQITIEKRPVGMSWADWDDDE